ncbi:ester cyclase [Priestia megaterium]|uniref:ester cyclase n=1 Tax=Priestia megaterium TaxID=1404 RepID=UPI0036720033
MKGFSKEYSNIVDYIIKITRDIWRELDIGLIYDTYSYNCIVHSGSTYREGVNDVISGTLQMLHAFPDRNGYAHNVIWSGNDEYGFYTSHRGMSVATNLEDSSFGPATGKRVMFRTTADCIIHNNKICEEWLVRDNLHLVQQLGFDPVEVAKRQARSTKGQTAKWNFGFPETAEEQKPPTVFVPSSQSFNIEDFFLEMFNKVWERRSFKYVKQFYKKNAVVHYICNKELVGHKQIQGQLVSLFASVPNAKVLIDRVTCNQIGENNDWDVSVRWRIQGLHEGIGLFGKPSGKQIEFFGINQYRVVNGKIREEWFTYDGLDVLKQIHADCEDVTESISKQKKFV